MVDKIVDVDFFSPEVLRCPHRAHQTLLRSGRLVGLRERDGGVVKVVPRHQDVKELMRSEQLTPSLFEGIPELADYMAGTAMDKFMQNHFFCAAPDKHRRLRQATSAGFSPRVMASFRPKLTALIEALLQPLRTGERIEFVTEVASVLPGRLMEKLFHFPEEKMPLFRRLGEAMDQVHSPGVAGGIASRMRAVDVFNDALPTLHGLMDERRARPLEDDFLSAMLQEEVDNVDGKGRLTPDEASAAAIVLVFSAVSTSIDVLNFAVLDFLEFPAQRALALSDENLLDNAVLEVIRREYPFPLGVPRFAVESFEFAGETIQKGERVCVMSSSAMRDASVYPDPDRFDVQRDQSGFLGFGYGPHYCVGSALAKMQVAELLRVFFREFPDAKLAAEPEFDNFVAGYRRFKSLTILP